MALLKVCGVSLWCGGCVSFNLPVVVGGGGEIGIVAWRQKFWC